MSGLHSTDTAHDRKITILLTMSSAKLNKLTKR